MEPNEHAVFDVLFPKGHASISMPVRITRSGSQCFKVLRR
jgi:hypothetical protein